MLAESSEDCLAVALYKRGSKAADMCRGRDGHRIASGVGRDWFNIFIDWLNICIYS